MCKLRTSRILFLCALFFIAMSSLALQEAVPAPASEYSRGGFGPQGALAKSRVARNAAGRTSANRSAPSTANPTLTPAKGDIITFAGGGPPAGTSPTSLAIGSSNATLVDKQGNVYIAASWIGRIYKVAPDGTVTTVVDGDARLELPEGLALDGAGNLFVADTGADKVFKIDVQGNVTTVAGTGAPGFSGDQGPATAAQLNFPRGLALDTAGNLFIADINNHRVRKIDTSGVISTFAGDGTAGFAGDNGPATSAELCPTGLSLDSTGNLFIADSCGNRARKVDSTGLITSVVGSSGNDPQGVAVDGAGNLYIAFSGDNLVNRISVSGTVTIVAGTGQNGFAGDGGPATSAKFDGAVGVSVDSVGNLYIADLVNSRIRKVDTSGTISTFAGNGTWGATGDGGPASSAELSDSQGLLIDGSGRVIIADGTNNKVRAVSAGVITTIAGTGHPFFGFSGDGGPATAAEMIFPSGTALDASGNLYIADSSNSRVRKVDSSGTITTVAGDGSASFSGDNGPALNAGIAAASVAVDGKGNLFISGNNRIRRVDPSGTITTVAGNGTGGFAGDGGPATLAELNFPYGIVFDAAGNLYIAEIGNNRVRKVDTSGIITTVAGGGFAGFSGDGGPATSASLNEPFAVAVDSANNLYIADTFNNRARKVDTQGNITTVAGSSVEGFAGDNGPAVNAELSLPQGIAVDVAGNVYIADSNNNRVREVLSGIAFSNSSLNFGAVNVSVPLSLSLQIINPANSTLNVASLAISGINANDFSQSGNCVGSIPVGGVCTATITFTPGTAAAETASLIVADDALSSPHAIPLTGTGVATFTLSPATNALTIPAAGGSASTVLTIAPGPAFTGSVNLVCAVMFQGQGTPVDPPSCALNPAQVIVPSSSTATLSIRTTAPSLSRLATPGAPLNYRLASTLAMLIGFVACILRRKNRRPALRLALLFTVVGLFVIGCGGSSMPVVQHRDPGTTSGSYAVTVTATHNNLTISTVVTVSVQ